jgi:hypothetical protein
VYLFRFCVGEQFFLVSNKIICKKDFDNLAMGTFDFSTADCSPKRPLAEFPRNFDLESNKRPLAELPRNFDPVLVKQNGGCWTRGERIANLEPSEKCTEPSLTLT